MIEHALCLLPPPDSGVMSRELHYTSVTRVKRQFTLVGALEVALAAVRQLTLRALGLNAIEVTPRGCVWPKGVGGGGAQAHDATDPLRERMAYRRAGCCSATCITLGYRS